MEIAGDLTTPLQGTLFRVVETGRRHRVVQQVCERSDDLLGVTVRCRPRELVAARPDTLAGYSHAINQARARELPHWEIHNLATADRVVIAAGTSEAAVGEYLETVVANLLVYPAPSG